MKLLIIQPSLPDYRISFFTKLAEHLGHQITVLHFGNPQNSNHPLVKEKIGEIVGFKGLIWVKGLNREIKGFNVIIQVFDPHFINLFFMPLSRGNRKSILWGHGLGKNNMVNLLRKFIYQKTDGIISYSDNGKKEIVDLGIPCEKIFVANNTLHISNSQDTSASAEKVFIYVGRLQKRKRLDIFLEIFHKLSLGIHGYSFLIVGDGKEEQEYLQSIVDKLELNSYVQFIPGTYEESLLYGYFKKCLYYVSPGPVGLGVLHSFAYGVPVLTLHSKEHGPEVDNIINDINGVVFQNKLDLETRLLKYLDPSVACNMGHNAYKYYVTEASVNKMVDGFIAALNA